MKVGSKIYLKWSQTMRLQNDIAGAENRDTARSL